jgi:hypothetical protein
MSVISLLAKLRLVDVPLDDVINAAVEFDYASFDHLVVEDSLALPCTTRAPPSS